MLRLSGKMHLMPWILEALIRNKVASGRPKDLADVAVLEELRSRRGV